jgi:hypothetical protein
MLDRCHVSHEHEQEADDEQHGLEGSDRDDRVPRLLDRRGRRDAEDPQTQSDERDASPLAALQLEPEESLGEHGEEDEPAGDDRLGQRQRRERKRAYVAHPADDRDRPADCPPL